MISRRALVGGACALLACRKSSPSSHSSATNLADTLAPPPLALKAAVSSQLLSWKFEASSVTGGDVVVLIPTDQTPPFRVLVALHGQGEALKPSHDGALGWANDYALVRAIDRVSKPPLVAEDFEGFADAARIVELNHQLAADPYRGLVVVCPEMRNIDPYSSADMGGFAQFVIHDVLPRVRREIPCSARRESTGIDGISLGGAMALRIGLTHPETFGAIGALQPAVHSAHIAGLVEIARAARAKSPNVPLRILTSDGDVFREPIRRLSAAWQAAQIDHEMIQVPGPHDYPFNRGPGSIELLTWHNRVLS